VTATRAARARISTAAWHEVQPAPVVLLSGPEDLIADRARDRVRETVLARGETETSELDAHDYAPGSLLSVASPSLFAQPRLILVDRLEQMSDAFLADALAYLEALDPDVALVLRHRRGNRGRRLLTAVRALDQAVEVSCDELKRDDQKRDFVLHALGSRGVRIEADAARSLVDAFSADTTELAAACRQLADDVGGTITRADIDRYFGGRVETTGFAIADAALAGRGAQALVLLRHARQQGMNAVPVVAAIAMKVRLMAAVCEVHEAPQRLAPRVGAAPWQVRRAQQDAARWRPDALARAVRAVAATDAAVKGGAADAGYALERLVRVLAARRP
jgi:DNA polymerase-3 subunit delta